ncbi:hypothetical protein IAQ61_009558, partial [Plenodomus lingam]|uniref:uncharacterized protein n=1 Tax=Leptosphaeria maculans TaxID=5022 RepID=UPI003321D120
HYKTRQTLHIFGRIGRKTACDECVFPFSVCIIIGRRYIGDEQNASGDSKAHGRTIGKEAQASPR